MFSLRCKAAKNGFYHDRMYYPVGSKDNEKRAGEVFVIRDDILRYDSEGRMEVDAELKPVLPSWIIPQEEVRPIDKSTPHIVKATKPRFAKRKLPAAVHAAKPKAWPANVQPSDEPDPERVVKTKSAGKPGAFGVGKKDEDED